MRQRYATVRPGWFIARLAAFVVVALALALARPPSASAHARLMTSNPPSGTALASVPVEIALTFSEAIDPAYSSASLLATDDASIPLGTPVSSPDGLTLIVPVADPSAVPPGTYTLVWRVLSAVDGHVTTGTVAFSAGTGVVPAAASGAETRPPWWRVALRWLTLTGLVLTTGIFAFALLAARQPLASLDGRARLLARIAVPATLLVVLLRGYDLGVAAAGTRFFDPPGGSVYRGLLADSTGGRAWVAVAVCVAAMALLLFSGRPRRHGHVAGLLAGLIALYATSAAGHAAAASPAWRAILFDWVHLAAVACWLGALPYLWLSLPRTRPASEPARAVATVNRFSRLGLALMGAIVLTGLLRAASEVAGPRALTGTDYGRVLVVKHLLVAPILVAAGVNRLVLVPRLRTSAGTALPSTRRFIGAELVAAALVLLAAGALTELAPANAPLPVAVASRPVTIDQRAAAGDLSIWMLAYLAGSATDRYTLTIEDAAGHGPADLQRVIVETRTAIGGETAGDRFDAEPLADTPNTYVFPALRLGLPGTWDLNVIVRRAGVEDVAGTFTVDTTDAAPRPPRLVDDAWRLPRVTLPAWLLGFLALASLLGGVIAVRLLRDLQPFAAAILLTMTALITAGFAVQGYRQTVPVSAGTGLVNPVPADEGSIQRGESLYRSLCLQCHGEGGAGLEAETPEHQHPRASLVDARTQNQRDGDLYWSITNGLGGTEMPAYDAALTEQERWDLVNYLRAAANGG